MYHIHVSHRSVVEFAARKQFYAKNGNVIEMSCKNSVGRCRRIWAKCIEPVYTFASRERICGQNDLGGISRLVVLKKPSKFGVQNLKTVKTGHKILKSMFYPSRRWM